MEAPSHDGIKPAERLTRASLFDELHSNSTNFIADNNVTVELVTAVLSLDLSERLYSNGSKKPAPRHETLASLFATFEAVLAAPLY